MESPGRAGLVTPNLPGMTPNRQSWVHVSSSPIPRHPPSFTTIHITIERKDRI
jgi:hypothetical protein